MKPNVERASRERIERIEEDARKASIELPPPLKFREKRRMRVAQKELRERGEDV